MNHSSQTPFKPSRRSNSKWKRFQLFLGSTILPISTFAFACLWAGRELVEISSIHAIKIMPTLEFTQTYVMVPPNTFSQKKLIAISDRAMAIIPPSIFIAKQATQQAIRYKKSCLPCQTRLAYIDILETGNLTNVGQKHLLHSYEISPYGEIELMQWRLTVSNLYWDNLSRELQTYALMQITALSETRKGQKWLKKFNSKVDVMRIRIDRLD